MHRFRVRLVVAASLATAAVAIGASCSFPVIIFQEGSSGSGGSTSTSTSASSAMSTTTSSAGGAGGTGGSTASESVSTSGSTSSGTGGSPPCSKACDCDGDGAIAYDCPMGAGTDCADHDERAHPGAEPVYETEKIRGQKSTKTTDFDFNCNGLTEPDYGIVSCTILGNGLCGGSGFKQTTACGTEGVFVPCGKTIGLLCGEQAETTKKQGCH